MIFRGDTYEYGVPCGINLFIGEIISIGKLAYTVAKLRIAYFAFFKQVKYRVLVAVAVEFIGIIDAKVFPGLLYPLKIDMKDNVAVVEYDVFDILHDNVGNLSANL